MSYRRHTISPAAERRKSRIGYDAGMNTADLVVCGAGVIGCAIARAASRAGAEVVVLERGEPGAEASGAAAGMLTPQSGFPEPGPLPEFARLSMALYPELSRALREESGIDVAFRGCGSVRLSGSEADEADMERLRRWQTGAGWDVVPLEEGRLEAFTCGALRAGLGGRALAFPEEGVVDNRKLVEALRQSAQASGARFRPGEAARQLTISSGACTGVRTARESFSARTVVDAAGCWAGFDPSVGFPVPVVPARGQIVELFAPGVELPMPVHWGSTYIAPHEKSRLLVGSTVEFVGYEKKVTARAVTDLLAGAIDLVPDLREAELTQVWSGLRPASSDGLPLLGETPVRGYILATGHFRNGILLAPATGEAVADLAAGKRPRFDLGPFRPERFFSRKSGAKLAAPFTARNGSW